MRDKEFIDLSNAYNQICEQSYGIDASKHGGPDKLLQKMVDEKKRRGDKDGGGEVVQSGLQKANYEPEGELVLEKDETEEGITGLPIPKKKMSPKKRHEFEKKRRVERKKRGDDRVGNTFSQHRMTGSRGHGSEHENIRSVREEVLVDYLLEEGFASDEKSAQAIAGAMSESWMQSIVEQASTVSSSGGAGGKVTVNKSYPATLNNQKGIKSTGPTGTEYFTPNFPGSNVPNRAESKFKSVASQQYEKVPSDQRTMDLNKPVSVTDRTKYDPSYKPPGMRK